MSMAARAGILYQPRRAPQVRPRKGALAVPREWRALGQTKSREHPT
jgi:hypothetical protein